MCYASEPLIHIFQVFFRLRTKVRCFDFLYKGKEFNLKKKFQTQIYLSTKCGQAVALCAL